MLLDSAMEIAVERLELSCGGTEKADIGMVNADAPL